MVDTAPRTSESPVIIFVSLIVFTSNRRDGRWGERNEVTGRKTVDCLIKRRGKSVAI